jgi:hypothetical protein
MATPGASTVASLGVSVVTYAPDERVLSRTLASLGAAILDARALGLLDRVRLALIDNGPDQHARAVADAAAGAFRDEVADAAVEVLGGHGNVGYGAGHNLALRGATGDFHLVLNPDVLIDANAVAAALRFMAAHPDVGLIAPRAAGADGRLQYLCKRHPSPWVLALRGFAPAWLRRRFDAALARYEMRDLIGDERVVLDVPIASGAFMFCRHAALAAVGGFDPRYFLYFEDFDLSLRLAKHARIAYVPAVRIVHFGGHSARKGAAHVGMFAASALRFFGQHGWRGAAVRPPAQ